MISRKLFLFGLVATANSFAVHSKLKSHNLPGVSAGNRISSAINSRFDKNDGYVYPNLYQEADHMLSCSEIIYCLASMRDLEGRQDALIKEGKPPLVKLNDPDYLRPKVDPKTGFFFDGLSIPELATYIGENEEEIKKDTEFYETFGPTLKSICKLAGPKEGKDARTREIMYIDDSQGDEKEVVYSLSIDKKKQRVILCFRGTSTTSDMLQDARIILKPCTLPNVEKEISVHTGFHDYLFDDEKHQANFGGLAEEANKYEAILYKIKPLLKANPTFKLYVTGHSLGASLSSLFAFVASQDPEVQKPVTCVSIASTYVGDAAWREVFQAAERAGDIRYLRVSNSVDVIPHGPPFDLGLNLYKHVGINLRLKKEEFYADKNPTWSLHFPTGGIINELGNAIRNNCITNFAVIPSRVLFMHGPPEYDRRLDYCRDELNKLYINDLYEDYFKV